MNKTQQIVLEARAALDAGELGEAKRKAGELAAHWREINGPTETQWECAGQILEEILAVHRTAMTPRDSLQAVPSAPDAEEMMEALKALEW
jgi:hypothetical protein